MTGYVARERTVRVPWTFELEHIDLAVDAEVICICEPDEPDTWDTPGCGPSAEIQEIEVVGLGFSDGEYEPTEKGMATDLGAVERRLLQVARESCWHYILSIKPDETLRIEDEAMRQASEESIAEYEAAMEAKYDAWKDEH